MKTYWCRECRKKPREENSSLGTGCTRKKENAISLKK